MALESTEEASEFFLEQKTEEIRFKVSKQVAQLLQEWANKAGLSVETLVGAIVSKWARGTGGVWRGTWSKGTRVVIDYPLDGHFIILRVPKGVK